MKKKAFEGMAFWQFDLLLNFPELAHASFLRQGGFSQDHFASLNVSFSVGDNPLHVRLNCEKVQRCLKLQTLARVEQCHGTDFQSIKLPKQPARTADALATKLLDVGLLISHADCQAAIIYDPIQKVIANIHAGWRGLVAGIYPKTIQNLQRLYGSKVENMMVCVSPSLGPENAEFIHYKNELPQAFWEYQTVPYYFDLWTIAEKEFLNSGILPHHIEMARINTYSQASDYFSFRRQKNSGRMATVIALKGKISMH